MQLISELIGAILLPAEMGFLFTVWQWRLKNKSVGGLCIAVALIGLMIVGLVLLPRSLLLTAFLGMAAIYLFSGLAWAWWADNLSPTRWTFGEFLVAGLATAIFSIAVGSAVQPPHKASTSVLPGSIT